MGNLHSYYADTGSVSWEHRLSQSHYQSIYLNPHARQQSQQHPAVITKENNSDQNNRVNDINWKSTPSLYSSTSMGSTSPYNSKIHTMNDPHLSSIDLFFADLPPTTHSYGGYKEIITILSQSTPFLPSSSFKTPFITYLDRTNTRLSRQYYELIYHHVNHTMMHAIISHNQLERIMNQQQKIAPQHMIPFIQTLQLAQHHELVDKDDQHKAATFLLKQVQSKISGKGGKRVLSSTLVELLEKGRSGIISGNGGTNGNGSGIIHMGGLSSYMLSSIETSQIKEMSSLLLSASYEQLNREDMERLLRASLALGMKSWHATQMFNTLHYLLSFQRLYGDIRLPIFSILNRFSHDMRPYIVAMIKPSAEPNIHQTNIEWRDLLLQKIQEAFSLLTINDMEKEKIRDTNKENVSLSYSTAFIAAHLAVIAETHIKYYMPTIGQSQMEEIDGSCMNEPQYVGFSSPFILDSSPESAVMLLDLLTTCIQLRSDHHLSIQHKRLYANIRSLFTPIQSSLTQSQATQTVQLLFNSLTILQSTPAGISSRTIKNGALFECIEAHPEVRQIMETIGFRLVDKPSSIGLDNGRDGVHSDDNSTPLIERMWFVEESEINHSFLSFSIAQLTRLNDVYYDTKSTKCSLDTIVSTLDHPISTSILSILSLIKVFFLTAKRNRVSPHLLIRPDVLCQHQIPLFQSLVNNLILLVGRDDNEFEDSDIHRVMEKEKAAEICSMTFSLLPSSSQLKILQHCLSCSVLRSAMIQMLSLEPMSFSFFPSQFSSSANSFSIWERICKGLNKDKSMCGWLADHDVVEWLISCHDSGVFKLKEGIEERERLKKGPIRMLWDWLNKPLSYIDDTTNHSNNNNSTMNSSPSSHALSVESSNPSSGYSSPLPSSSPLPIPVSEEKKDNTNDDSPLLTTSSSLSNSLSMPSPPGFSMQRSISTIPSVDPVDMSDYASLFDLFFYYLTSSASNSSLINDILQIMLIIQRCLFVRTLCAFNQYDRNTTPHLLLAYASSVIQHASDYIITLKYHAPMVSSTTGEQVNSSYSYNMTGTMTSLTPSFPPSTITPPDYLHQLHSSPFSPLLPPFLLSFAFITSLPNLSLPLDEHLLTSTHGLLNQLGGYAGLEDDRDLEIWNTNDERNRRKRGYRIQTEVEEKDGEKLRQAQEELDRLCQVTNTESIDDYIAAQSDLSVRSILFEPFIARQPASSSLLRTIYTPLTPSATKADDKVKILNVLCSEFIESIQHPHPHPHAHHYRLPIDLLPLVDHFVFNEPIHKSKGSAFSSFVGRMSFPSHHVCIVCGEITRSRSDVLLPHYYAESAANCVCHQPIPWFQFLRHSVVWQLAKISRHMAIAAPTDLPAVLSATPPQRDRKASANDSTAANSNGDRPFTTGTDDTVLPSIPRSVGQWLQSDLMRSGLEDSFVSKPTPSIISLGLSSSLNTSVTQSLESSTITSPTLRPAAITAINNPKSSTAATIVTTLPNAPPPLTVATRPQFDPNYHSSSTSSNVMSDLTSKSPTIPSSPYCESASEYSKGVSPVYSLSIPVRSSVQFPSGQLLFEKVDQEKVLEDLQNKGSVTIESPRGTVTMSVTGITHNNNSNLPTANNPNNTIKEDDNRLMKMAAMGMTVHTKPTLSNYSRSDLSLQISSLADRYDHAQYLHDLIYGDNEAGQLDAAIMASPSMKMFVTKRRIVGKKATEGSRGIIAALLKHTNKIELALDEFSLYEDEPEHTFAASLVKAWKQGSEILGDMIAAHQQGMRYYCTVRGCDSETVELHDPQGLNHYKCSHGHLQDNCREQETITYDAMADRVMSNCAFLLTLRPSLSSSPSLQLQRLNSIKMKKLLFLRPPSSSPAPSPDRSPLYIEDGDEQEELIGDGQQKQVKNNKQPKQQQKSSRSSYHHLGPAPNLTWSTTSAAAAKTRLLTAPNVELVSPQSAPIPGSKNRTISMDDGHLPRIIGNADLTPDGNSTPPHGTTPDIGNRIMRRSSMGAIPARLDDSLIQRTTSAAKKQQDKRERFKQRVKREVQAHKWRELRDDLLLHRNSLMSCFNRLPLSALVLSFAKDMNVNTAHMTDQLDLAMRSSISRAERRVKGLESLCLMMKNGGMKVKMLALIEIRSIIKHWNIDDGQKMEKKTTNPTNSTSTTTTTTTSNNNNPLAAEDSQQVSSAAKSLFSEFSSPSLSIQRYDNNLSTCGTVRLGMVTDAFYILSGLNVSLMRQCINAMLTAAVPRQSKTVNNSGLNDMSSGSTLSAELAGLDGQGRDVSPLLMTTSLSSGVSSTSGSLSISSTSTISPSDALTVLLACLNCWQISFHRSDFAFLRTTGILSVIDTLITSYPSLPLTQTQSILLNDEEDRLKVAAIGKKSRSIFRLLALSSLTLEPIQAKVALDDLSDQEKEKDTKEKVKDTDPSIAVDSFENMLLNCMFARLETIIARVHRRYKQDNPKRIASNQQQQHEAESNDNLSEEDSDDEQELPNRIRRLQAGRYMRSTSTSAASFTLSADSQSIQDEEDCVELLSLLLLCCSSARIRLTLTHSYVDDSAPPSPAAQQLLSPFSSFALPLSARCLLVLLSLTSSLSFQSLSTRCIRRTLRICQQLFPLITPTTIDSVFSSSLDSIEEDEDGGSPDDHHHQYYSPYIQHLLSSIGYFSCGRFLERSIYSSTASHSSALAAEMTALLRLLSCSCSWSNVISYGLSKSFLHIQHKQFLVTDQLSRRRFYRCWGSLSVYGGSTDEARIGGRIKIGKVSLRNEKLSKEIHLQVDGVVHPDRYGTIIGFHQHYPLIVYDCDQAFTVHMLSITQCSYIPVVPCLQPLHIGTYGTQNLTAVVNYINQAFSSSSSNSAFALYPIAVQPGKEVDTSGKDQHMNYVHSMMKVLAVKVLYYAISINLTQPTTMINNEPVSNGNGANQAAGTSLLSMTSNNVLVGPGTQSSTNSNTTTSSSSSASTSTSASSSSGNPAKQFLTLILQSMLRDSPLSSLLPRSPTGSDGSAKSSNTLMANLLSIAQNVIPLTQGVGKLEELERKQVQLHALLHERPVSHPIPQEMKQLSIHIDLCHRALSLYGSSSNTLLQAISWCKRKHIEIKLLEEEQKKERERVNDVVRGLQDMGFDISLCHRALLLCNGDSNQAVNYLVEHGMALQDALRNGIQTDNWGLEGVDFYQEKGHWIPEVSRDTDEQEMKGMTTGESSLMKDKPHQPSSTPPISTSALLSIPSITDPYRRLALSTAPQLKAQSLLNERFAIEQQGLKGRKVITCSLDDDDVLKIGQLLRINSSWCVTQQQETNNLSAQNHPNSTSYEYRWYFLTEDNNWAPLDRKDMLTLDEASESGISVTWIGMEEKSPSLVRLDKMCMYNELTGHGRPIKKRKIEIHNTGSTTTTRTTDQQQISNTANHNKSMEPPIVESLYSTLTPDMQRMASELAALGFPISHCARALLETRGNIETAANWIISNESILEAMDKEENKRRQKREEWEKEQKRKEELKKESASHLSSTNNIDIVRPPTDGQPVEYSVNLADVFAHSGQLGTVTQISADRTHVLLSITEPDSCRLTSLWLPISACEYDDTHIIHLLPELNNRRFQGISGLALDVASSEFILYARRCVLLLLYLLSCEKGGKMELIKNLNANVFMRVIKLAKADPGPMTIPIYIPYWMNITKLTIPSVPTIPNTSNTMNSSHPAMIDLWLILQSILHNPSPFFASSVRDQLLHQLVEEVRLHLMTASSTVRDVDTEHPYQSNINEKQEIRIENASHLLVTFDRRCNINQAHASLSFYADVECTQELAVFSGSADEFSHIVIPGNHFYYQFISGSLRQKPYEFGFRFRVRPLGYNYKDETSLLSYSLGWPILAMLCDSYQLIDLILGFQVCMDLISSMLRYLTVCRSPCKVMVTRCLTALCVRIKQPMPSQMFEILLRVMEQLYESNTASGWGSSPFLMALVDLIRLRPTFKLSDSELWSVETIDNRPAGWFFLTVLRAESLSRSLYSSNKLPSIKILERAYHELSDIEILRWCLKQPELCLKLHKQTRGWNTYRRDWMTGINGFTAFSQAADVLIALKQSLLPECYRYPAWTQGTAGKEWEDKVKKSQSSGDIARCYMELEAALKWGDSYPETERAFGDTWGSRRQDWIAAMKGLAAANQVKVASIHEAIDYRWYRALDEQLVSYIDDFANKSARRLMSLTLRDLEPLSKADMENPHYSLIKSIPIEYLRARFAVLKMISTDYMRVLPVVDLSLRATWSISPLVRHVSKSLIFQQSKMYLWRSMLGRLYSEERPQFVILNRQEAAKKRKDARSHLIHSLFYQLYSHIGLLVDPSSLRRRGQAWMVKFVGEGGHDVGGLYNESLVDICNSLQAEGNPNHSHDHILPLFRLCPNGRHAIGDNRNKYIPNSSATSSLAHSMLEFIGRLMGICCLDNNRALPLDLCSMVWKVVAAESITMNDLKNIDYHCWNTINIIRNPAINQLNERSFPYLFPYLFFTTESSAGIEAPLCDGGEHIPVTYTNSGLYAQLLEQYKLNEYNAQIASIARGLYSIIPYEFLSIFNAEQLEIMITGSPEIDIPLLKDKTEYRGNVSIRDRHIQYFWDVVESFSEEEKKLFLQFVSGRSRLPATALGFGKDMFKLSDHAAAMNAMGASNNNNNNNNNTTADAYLPVAHTCFFALELPRYSNKAVMKNKLLYAIRNCVSIDGDATHEGRANMMMTWSDSE